MMRRRESLSLSKSSFLRVLEILKNLERGTILGGEKIQSQFVRWEGTLSTKIIITRHLHVLMCCLSRKVLKKIRRQTNKSKNSF